MAWLISVLGAVLALAGAISLGNGISYIRLDWGQTQTLAGTMALSCGIVTIALGAVLFALRDITRRPLRPAASGIGMEALSEKDVEAPGRPARSRFTSKLATVGMPRPDPAEPLTAAGGPAPPRDLDAPQPADLPAHDPSLRPSFRTDPETARISEDHVGADALPPEPVPVDTPTVVGRYEANGASYVLFSDGTIEVETESGTHRFASMTDLKDHIERQEAG